MKHYIHKSLAFSIILLIFNLPLSAQKQGKAERQIFKDSLAMIVKDAADSFKAITGKSVTGLDGLYDVPYKTYMSETSIPGGYLSYVMSNKDFSDEKHFSVFVCHYFMNPDSATAAKAFIKLSSLIKSSEKGNMLCLRTYQNMEHNPNEPLKKLQVVLRNANNAKQAHTVLAASFEKRNFGTKVSYEVYFKIQNQ